MLKKPSINLAKIKLFSNKTTRKSIVIKHEIKNAKKFIGISLMFIKMLGKSWTK